MSTSFTVNYSVALASYIHIVTVHVHYTVVFVFVDCLLPVLTIGHVSQSSLHVL